MRLLFAAALFALPAAAMADDVTAQSRVISAKVFLSGASVTRAAELSLPAGRHRVTLTGVPQTLDVASLLLGSSALDGLTVQSSQFIAEAAPIAPPRTPAMEQAESDLVAAEVALNQFEQDRLGLESALAAARLRIAYLNGIAEDGGTAAGDTGLTAESLAALTAELGAQIAAATQEAKAAAIALQGSERGLQDLQRAVDRARRALELATPPERVTGAVVLDLTAEQPFDGSLFLGYLARDARWQPGYELRVAQTGDNGAVQLNREAVVYQNSGEDWRDVDLILSTAELDARSQVFIPESTLYWLADQPEIMTLKRGNVLESAMAEPMMDQMASGGAEVATHGQTLEFELGTVAGVRGDGGGLQLTLDVIAGDQRLYALANARLDETALLYTDLTNDTGGTLLGGPMQVYRDGVLTVASAYLPQTANGDVLHLPLGPLNGLLLEHRTLQTQAGESGIVTTRDTREERYAVDVDSKLDYPIDLTVYEALPVSEDEDLDVRLQTKPEPSEQAVEGRRGVVGWTKRIEPGDKTTIEYGWTLRWPEDKQLLQR